LCRNTYNYTLGWVLPNFDVSEDSVVVPLNAARLVDDLLQVHGHEVLIDGCFNADPHPGNILHADGKLALIDYGQVKRLTKEQRLEFAKTIVLTEAAIKVDPRTDRNVDPKVHARAKQSIVDHNIAIGMKTEKMLPQTLYELTTTWFGRMDAAWVYPLNMVQWTDKMQDLDPMGSLDDVDYVIMVTMASMMLLGLGQMLQQPRNLATMWAPFARQALEEEGLLEDVEKEIASWTA